MITGILTTASELRAIFPNGIVPLTHVNPVNCAVGADYSKSEVCYFVSLRACTNEQLDLMASKMSAQGQGTVEEARAWLAHEPELPVRTIHFSGVSISLRSII